MKMFHKQWRSDTFAQCFCFVLDITQLVLSSHERYLFEASSTGPTMLQTTGFY